MKLTQPTQKDISNIIPPNYSTWETIELTYQCAKYAVDNNISGVFVECGVASGNNLAAMCLAGKMGIGFDSFEGIPWASDKDDEQPGMRSKRADKNGELESSGITVHSIEGVHKNFARWKIDNYRLVKGWFQHTVADFDEDIAVLRLDGDLYESTLKCLAALYPRLSKGGILIMDDWNLAGCRRAFEDYFIFVSDHSEPTLIFDNGVTYWQK